MVKCPECGASADLTKDGSYAHCASCMFSLIYSELYIYGPREEAHVLIMKGNTIFEPGKEGSGYKGSGSGSGDKEEGKKEGEKEGK